MRVRTDARRNAILKAAWKVFKRVGFERASMADIADKANCSKATLYSYFKSKDELFTFAMELMLGESSEATIRGLSQPDSLPARLLAFARAHMRSRLSPDMIAVERIMVEAADHRNVYAMLRRKSQGRRMRIAEVLAAEMEAGHLRGADPILAATQLLGLIEFDLANRRLHGEKDITAEMIEAHVQSGVEAFLRAYAAR